ncbi:tetratricopeptide repeat protein [Desulfoprunum benzoelyticum]|uniref:Tetratricopeptide (TPR) repeat protein n=1 Tax=Desulfoprunum benzoelyticum TaxID=1506996 RepID=A0A840UYN8_9BACT|nr:tetratricopeptide repeat protein [Desulfoprunum benzoelyticum]MBB5346559.1 tetratricopeptide (TPR) repeat protein [Desulfoprunum benzoelyticum]MBM9528912.1 tetratricopeptide repeat protein [Desulfoprunum benzoelyticum]
MFLCRWCRQAARALLWSAVLCGTIPFPTASLCAATAPSRDSIIILDTPSLPAWKTLWDEAREFVQRRDYILAARTYADLIKLKPQVMEIRWEYCNVLVELNDWLSAAELIENLLETDDSRHDYLLLAGRIAVENKEYKRAVEYYGRVYDDDPSGPSSVGALKGLINGLEGQGKKNAAFPLMERLYQRTPNDKELLQKLAGTAQDLGDLPKAKDYYAALVNQFTTDESTLMRASSAFEKSGADKDALAIWEKYLERSPGYIPFHKKIADYYMLIGKSGSALPHILYMIEQGVEDDELLLVAGRILLHDQARPDKALQYLEQYVEKHPEDIATGFEIQKIRALLAEDFISIVENDGVRMLWDDLVKITPNREAIYLKIAEKLEHKKKWKDLLKILLVIHQNHPLDQENMFRIARIYFRLGDYQASLDYQRKMTGGPTAGYQYLLLRARTEEKLGRDIEALHHYSAILHKTPGDAVVRSRAVQLAGRLGLVDDLKKLYLQSGGDRADAMDLDLSLRYLHGLRENLLFDEAWDLYDLLLRLHGEKTELERKILLHKAEALLASRQDFLAEQVLRELLVRNEALDTIVLQLGYLALKVKDTKAAREWFAVLKKRQKNNDWRACADRHGRNLYRLHIAILLAEGRFEQAVADLHNLRVRLQGNSGNQEVADFQLEMEIEECRALYQLGEYDTCLKILGLLREHRKDSIETAVLWFQITKRKGKSATAFREIDQMLKQAGRLSPVRLFEAVEVEREYGEFEAGLHHLDLILQMLPHSVRARALKAELLLMNGDFAESLQWYQALVGEVGEQQLVRNRILELQLKLGNLDKVVKESEEDVAPQEKEENGTPGKRPIPDYWRRLLLARALWTDRQWDEAIKVYEHLLDDPVEQDFRSAMAAEKIAVFHPPLKKSIWQMLSLDSPQKTDPLAHYMAPEYVSHHFGQPVDSITARMYEKYRWQRLIQNEYQARKAEKRKDILAAERQYKQLLEQDVSAEGLYDLARIYGRLGEYGKEAELYQVIRRYGPAYPELKEAIRRNEVLRKPRLSADAETVEKEGRNGYIDTLRTSQGGTLWMMPDFDSEISLEYRRNSYTDSKDIDTIRGHRVEGLYSRELPGNFDLQLRAGAEDLDDFDTTAIAGARLNSRFDQYVKGYLLFDQNAVYDTLAALQQGIYLQDYETGLIVETPKGIALGADYRRRRYSDDNSQNQFHLWSGYAIYAEATTFKFQYDYRIIDNSEASSVVFPTVSDEGFAETPLYWSPDEYWEHLGTISFQHLLKEFSLTRGTPSYYSLDYSMGFESGENFTHKIGFEILLEMSPHFLLKGNLSFATSDEYEQKGALVSLMYRW